MMINKIFAKFNKKYLKKFQVFKVPESFSNIGLSGYKNIFTKINNLNS